MVKITVPATSANMGPGFDCIGMAFNMYNVLFVERMKKPGLCIEVENFGDVIPNNNENMIYQTIQDFFYRVGKKMPGIHMIQRDNIPISRGLGSSAACIVAGLMAANELSEVYLSRDEIAQLAARIERHPDNVAPAIYGGMVVGAMERDHKYMNFVKFTVPESLSFAVMIPEFTLSTEIARGILPKTLNRDEAVFNISRAALLVSSIVSEQWGNLKIATEDALHQPFRKELIPNMEEIFEKADDAGSLGYFLSGAGPALIALIKKKDEDKFSKEMNSFLSGLSDVWNLHLLRPNNDGATIEPVE